MPIRIGAIPDPSLAPAARRRSGTSTERTASMSSATPFAPGPSGLDRVALGRELEIARPDRRRDHRSGGFRCAHRLDVSQNVHGAVVEAEIPDRPDDLAFFDEPQPVAREARELDVQRVHGANVEEVRHEEAPLGPPDELVDGARPALEHDAAGERKRLEPVPGGPVAVDRNGFHDSLFDPRRPARWKLRRGAASGAPEARKRSAASGDPGASRQPRVERIRAQRYDRREDLFADPVAAARLRQEAPPLVDGPARERRKEAAEEIRDGPRLEDDRI